MELGTSCVVDQLKAGCYSIVYNGAWHSECKQKVLRYCSSGNGAQTSGAWHTRGRSRAGHRSGQAMVQMPENFKLTDGWPLTNTSGFVWNVV